MIHLLCHRGTYTPRLLLDFSMSMLFLCTQEEELWRIHHVLEVAGIRW